MADPHLVLAGLFLLVAPDTLWGRHALKLTCDPVRPGCATIEMPL